jgi:hypothetical protein
MQFWRDLPVLSVALIGAFVGLVNAAIFLFIDPLRPLSSRFLLCLFPTSILGFGFLEGSTSFSIFLVIVEVCGNALLYGCTFAAPAAAVIAVRRQFGPPGRPTSVSGS